MKNLYGKLVNRQTGDQVKYFDDIEEIRRWFWVGTKWDRGHIAYLFDFCPTVDSPVMFPITNCEEII